MDSKDTLYLFNKTDVMYLNFWFSYQAIYDLLHRKVNAIVVHWTFWTVALYRS